MPSNAGARGNAQGNNLRRLLCYVETRSPIEKNLKPMIPRLLLTSESYHWSLRVFTVWMKLDCLNLMHLMLEPIVPIINISTSASLEIMLLGLQVKRQSENHFRIIHQ